MPETHCKPPFCTCGEHIHEDDQTIDIDSCFYGGCDKHTNLGERTTIKPMPPTPNTPTWPIGPIQGGICTQCGINYLLPECRCAEVILQAAHEAEEAGLIEWDTTRREWVDVRP